MLQTHAVSVPGISPKSRSIRSTATGHSYQWVPSVLHRVATAARSRSRKHENGFKTGSLVSFSNDHASVQKKVGQVEAFRGADPYGNEPSKLFRSTTANDAPPSQRDTCGSKPLPEPPGLTLSPGPDSTLVSLSKLSPSVLSAFSKELESRFLTPIEQQVLQSIQWLSESLASPATTLVQLGGDAFWMCSNDANMLHRIDVLTETLSRAEKQILLRNLDPLLKSAYKYPLKQVLRNGFRMISTRQELVKTDDNESLIDLYSELDSSGCKFEPIDESKKHFKPLPLKINTQNNLARQGTLDDTEQLSRSHEYPNNHTPEGTGGLSDHLDCVKAAHEIPRQPGSVGRARSRLVKAVEQAAEEARLEVRSLSANKHTLESRDAKLPGVDAQPGDVPDTISGISKQPGSVRHALDGLFENPRPAPKPAASVARPVPQGAAKTTYKHPGSVTRARTAAQEKLSLQQSPHLDRNLCSADARPLAARIGSPQHPGSVRRARNNLISQKDEGHARRLASLPLPPAEELRRNESYEIRDSSKRLVQNSDGQERPENERTALEHRLGNENTDPNALPNLNIIPRRLRSASSQKGSIANLESGRILQSIRPTIDSAQFSTLHEQLRGLRGGGNSDNDGPPSTPNPLRRSLSALFTGKKVIPLADDERPPKPIWYLAGGRTSFAKHGSKRVPTAGELRERRKVEEANREVVGFVGTVFGVRAVRQLSSRPTEDEVEDDGDANNQKKEETLEGSKSA